MRRKKSGIEDTFVKPFTNVFDGRAPLANAPRSPEREKNEESLIREFIFAAEEYCVGQPVPFRHQRSRAHGSFNTFRMADLQPRCSPITPKITDLTLRLKLQ